MPELPEVEATRRDLERWARGARIVDARSSDALVVPKPRALGGALIGRTIKAFVRRGKYIRFLLDDGTLVFSHFGMSGRWVKRGAGDPAERFERARIDVERRGKTTSLRYADPRRLGRLLVTSDDIRGWKALGPDPLHDGVDPKALGAALKRKRTLSVKEALLDPSVVAGIGNYLAAEALWVAKIHPAEPAPSLDDRAVRALVRGIDASIDRAIRRVDDAAKRYFGDGAEDTMHAYGRHGKPCPRCKIEMIRIVQAGRSTVFCPKCQAPVQVRTGARARSRLAQASRAARAHTSPSRPSKRIVRK